MTATSPRTIRAPRGTEISCRGWLTEAPLRMLMNNLDPEVAEDPDSLVVYGGTGRAARSWEAFESICASLRSMQLDETLLVASGKLRYHGSLGFELVVHMDPVHFQIPPRCVRAAHWACTSGAML